MTRHRTKASEHFNADIRRRMADQLSNAARQIGELQAINRELLAALKAYTIASANIAEADHTVALSREDRAALMDAQQGFALFDDGNMEARADLMIVVADALASIMRDAIAGKGK